MVRSLASDTGSASFFEAPGILVHFVEEQVPDRLAGQLRGAVGADDAQIHSVELKLRLGGIVLPEPLPERLRGLKHRPQPVDNDTLSESVGGIHDHAGGWVLVDHPAEHILEAFGASTWDGFTKMISSVS